MTNEKLKKRREDRKTEGISTFAFLVLLSLAVVLVGGLIMFLGVRIIDRSGNLDSLPLQICIIDLLMLAILMTFIFFSLRSLSDLKKAADAAERGDAVADSDSEGDIADLINVVGRVSTRMSLNVDKQAKTSDDYKAFVPNGILEYCHVDPRKEIEPGVIGTIKGTRALIILGNYKAGTDPRQYANLIDRIIGRGGRMLSSTSEMICAFFPGRQEEDVRFIEAELKESQILNVRYGTFDIVLVGSRTCMYVRAREHLYKESD